MKTISMFFTIVFLAAVTLNSSAQSAAKAQGGQKTEAFKVWGKCDMCKNRIEKGLKLDGISKAAWDEKTQLATVTYDPAKTNVDAMQKKLASIGHDTEKYKAPDDVYAKLPDCCHYERTK
jgi:mercuric ion binding protein